MTYIEDNYAPVWCSHGKPVKVWATSRRTYHAKIDKAKYAYNFICSANFDLPIILSEIDHIEIMPKCVKFYFVNTVLQDVSKVLRRDYEDTYIICADKYIVVGY